MKTIYIIMGFFIFLTLIICVFSLNKERYKDIKSNTIISPVNILNTDNVNIDTMQYIWRNKSLEQCDQGDAFYGFDFINTKAREVDVFFPVTGKIKNIQYDPDTIFITTEDDMQLVIWFYKPYKPDLQLKIGDIINQEELLNLDRTNIKRISFRDFNDGNWQYKYTGKIGHILANKVDC